jgi:hypothetical protein
MTMTTTLAQLKAAIAEKGESLCYGEFCRKLGLIPLDEYAATLWGQWRDLVAAFRPWEPAELARLLAEDVGRRRDERD